MNRRYLVFLVGIFLLVFVVPLPFRPLSISDEARYAEIPREMLASGDWVVPRLNGLRYFEKPPLGYWLTALSMKAFGQNNFAGRFPSSLAAGLTALLIFWLVYRQSRDTPWAVLSVTIYLTSFLVLAVGNTIVLDGMLTLFVTAAIAFFFAYHQEPGPRKKTVLIALFGLCCGLGFLTKGFVAFAVPVLVIVPFWCWCGKWNDLLLFPALPIFVAAAVVLPWAVAIHLLEPDFWRYFFWEEHIRRYAGQNPQHAEPFWFFLPILALGSLPWTFVAPAACMGWRRKEFAEPLPRYVLCWLAIPFLFFSVSAGKLGTYILPCSPPLAILLARGLTQYLARARHPAFNRGARLLAAVSVGGAFVLLWTQLSPGFAHKMYLEHETGDWMILFAGLLAWSAMLAASARPTPPVYKLALFAAAPALLFSTFRCALPFQLKAGRSAQAFLVKQVPRIPADSLVVSDIHHTHSGCWFLKRNDLYLMGRGEFHYGLGYPEAEHRFLELPQLVELLNHARGKQRVTLFTNRGRWDRFAHLLPAPSFFDVDRPDPDNAAVLVAQFD